MKIDAVSKLLHAKCFCGTINNENELQYAFSSDLMSDVLTLEVDGIALITGLCNPQTIRTAEMADIKLIIMVRDKQPSTEMIELARQSQITIIGTKHSMFYTSGILFQQGLKSVF